MEVCRYLYIRIKQMNWTPHFHISACTLTNILLQVKRLVETGTVTVDQGMRSCWALLKQLAF